MKQEFTIKGMTCNHCVARVEDSVKNLDGVKKVKVNLKKESGSVKFDEAVLSAGDIVAAIKAAGYEAEVN